MVGWMRRGDRVDPELLTALLDLAVKNPVISELALRELAFGGADPLAIIETLMARGEDRLAGVFGRAVLKSAPLRQKQKFSRYLAAGSQSAINSAERLLWAGTEKSALPKGKVLDGVRKRWTDQLDDSYSLLQVPEVARNAPLADALALHVKATRDLFFALDGRRPGPIARSLTTEQARQLLDEHPDTWVRNCVKTIPQLSLELPQNGDAMASLIERVLFLKETQLFMEVDISVLMHVAENLESRKVLAGHAVLKNGDKSGGLYLISSGQVEVTQQRGGKTVVIANLGPRDSVGELSALNDTPATADCTAITPLEVYFLSSPVLASLMHQHPRLSIGIIRMLSQRLMSTTERVRPSAPPPPPAPVKPAGAARPAPPVVTA
jgi:CRP-like cAMP-binding protein